MEFPPTQITPKQLQEKLITSIHETPKELSPFNLSDEEFWEEWGQTVQVTSSSLVNTEINEAGIQKRRLQLTERPFPFNKIFTETPPYLPYDYEQQEASSPSYPTTPDNPEYSNLEFNHSLGSESLHTFTPSEYYQKDGNESPKDVNQEEFWKEWAEEFKTPPTSIIKSSHLTEDMDKKDFTPEEMVLTKFPVSTPSSDINRKIAESPDSANFPSLAFVTVRRTGRRDKRFQVRNSTPGSPLNPNHRKPDARANITSITERFSKVQLNIDDDENRDDQGSFAGDECEHSEVSSGHDEDDSISEAFYTPAPRGRRRMVILSDEEPECDGESIDIPPSTEASLIENDAHAVATEKPVCDYDSEHETLEFNVDSEATMIETNSSLNCTPEKLKEDIFDSPESPFTVKRRLKVNRLLVVDSDDDDLDSGKSQRSLPSFQPIEVDLNHPEFDIEAKSDETTPHITTPSNPQHQTFDSPEVINSQPHPRRKYVVDSAEETSENEVESQEISSDESDMDSGIIVYEGNITNRVIEIKDDDSFWMEPPETPQNPGPRTPFRTPQSVSLINSSTARQFKKHREHLTRELFHEYNRKVFDNKLPKEMKITWSVTLKTTAGRAISHRQRRDDEWTYVSRVELSTKVVDSLDRLRNTLAHELCHCAAWIIDHIAKPAHGAEFKYWAKRVMKVYPDLNITTCHSYEIAYKYYFECVNPLCKKVYGRHSKSIDTDKHACGVCRSKLREMERLKKDGTPFKKREPNKYQLFVKENFKRVKESNPYASHAQVMSMLSAEYKQKTTQESNAIDELANSIHRIELE